jgi:phosphoethanolamine N-methyltransferase
MFMTTAASTPAVSQSYDNNGQYSRSGILRYEKIFGAGYVSTGGPETTAYLCAKLAGALHKGVRVLDVGSGIGGAAFHLAREYGAVVTGVDLADEMVQIAQERRRQLGNPQAVTFLKADILTAAFDDRFDIIWSRDALMHIADKPRLFARLHDLLVPGGKLVITDYARGAGNVSPEFQAYARETGYHLTDPASYGKLLEAAGFAAVEVEDATDKFVAILKREPKQLADRRGDFLQSFSEDDLSYLEKRWAMKVRFCQAGDMKWGIYLATKRA